MRQNLKQGFAIATRRAIMGGLLAAGLGLGLTSTVAPSALAQNSAETQSSEDNSSPRVNSLTGQLAPLAQEDTQDQAYRDKIIRLSLAGSQPESQAESQAGAGPSSVLINNNHNVDLTIYFKPDGQTLEERSQHLLKDLAIALDKPQMKNARFLLAGHINGIEGGKPESELSRNRADIIRAWLVDNLGIDGQRLVTAGFGAGPSQDPTASNTSLNQRIQVVLLEQETRENNVESGIALSSGQHPRGSHGAAPVRKINKIIAGKGHKADIKAFYGQAHHAKPQYHYGQADSKGHSIAASPSGLYAGADAEQDHGYKNHSHQSYEQRGFTYVPSEHFSGSKSPYSVQALSDYELPDGDASSLYVWSNGESYDVYATPCTGTLRDPRPQFQDLDDYYSRGPVYWPKKGEISVTYNKASPKIYYKTEKPVHYK